MRTLKQPDKEAEKRGKQDKPLASPAPKSTDDDLVHDTIGKEVRLEGFGPVLLYSEPSGEDGVRLHLRDDKSLLARLTDIPLEDLPEPNIDILLHPEITLVGGEGSLDLFGPEASEELRSISPETLARGAESFVTDTTLSLTVPQPDHETVDSSSEGPKSDGRVVTNRKPAKSCSPNRQGPQRCPVCGKVFGNASALAKHKLTHSDERRYVCSMCAKAFKRQDHLNGHMLTHRNKKPYECKAEGCGKSYCDARSLRRHTENHHSGSGSNSTTPEPSPPTCIQYAPPTARDSKGNPIINTKGVVSCAKPVECNLCHRKFKNIPALNGHMRLHGGYFKKDADPRRYERRDVNTQPLQTASISVRALIEEKIILKRITKPSSTTNRGQTQIDETSEDSTKAGSNNTKKPLSQPIIKKSQKVGLKRTTSDSGNLKRNGSALTAQLRQNNRAFSLDEYNEESEILSPSLQGDVFQEGQDSVLLEGVDSNSLEESINAADLEDIAIDGYHSPSESLPSPQSFQHHQDVRSVLDSPLPANLAEFAYDHSQNAESQANSQNFPNGSLTANLTFSSTSITQASTFTSLSSKAQGALSSSTTYFSHNITSTSGVVESGLMTSRSSLPSSSAQGSTLQSQMMPNSDDPLLSSSPKDFVSRKRVDVHTIKLLQNNAQSTTNQNLTGLVLDRNGELKLVHPGSTHSSKQFPVNVNNYGSTKVVNGTKMIKASSLPCKSNYLKNGEKFGTVFLENIKEENDEETFVSPSLAAPPVHFMRKRPRLDNAHQVAYRSRLRHVRKNYGNSSIHYTPPPILQPTRQGLGLYWQTATSSPSSTTLSKGPNWDEGPDVPESDANPHVNIGPEYQCEIPDLLDEDEKENLKEQPLWETKMSQVVSDIEVDKYLEFACCAAIPGGGRNKEHALHLLQVCQGQIQDAIMQLMQPDPWLPIGHPLLTLEYSDCDNWSLCEMEAFQQALLKHDKDFTSVAREVTSKTAKQCVQFYYIWKKVCPEDYKKLRILRKKYRESENETESPKVEAQNGDADLVTTTSSEGRLFVCEYNDCSASFNSRAALNGHIRIHVGGTATRCGTPDKRSPLQVTESMEEFPCKLCGKVFNKVKSRSAHMKSHRPPEAEIKKPKSEQIKNDQEQASPSKSTTVSSSLPAQKNG